MVCTSTSIPWRWIVSRRNSSASATTAPRCTRVTVGPRGREKSSTCRMILVMRATSSPMMPAFFTTSAASAPFDGDRLKLDGPTFGRVVGRLAWPSRCLLGPFGHGPRAAADDVEGRAELVGDLGRHLADRRQLLRLAQPRLQAQARPRRPLGLLARLAQRAGHGVEPAGDRPDLVVALGQDDPRQIALADGVDPFEQAAQRPHHDLFDREAHADGHGDHHQQEQRVDPARGGRHLGVDVAGVAPHPHDRRRVARRVARRQLQRGGVEQRHRHRVRARPRRRIEQAADRAVLDVGRAHQQAARRRRRCAARCRSTAPPARTARRAGGRRGRGPAASLRPCPDRAARCRRGARWRSRAPRDRDRPPGSRAAP